MADVLTTEQRRRCMSQVKSKNTKPEMLVRSYLHAKGFRFRLHKKDLPGKPDIVLPRYKTAIFVNGCFWHGHEGCSYAALPSTNKEFWETKISQNRERDERTYEKLHSMGWNVIVIWQCQLKQKTKEQTLIKLTHDIKHG